MGSPPSPRMVGPAGWEDSSSPPAAAAAGLAIVPYGAASAVACASWRGGAALAACKGGKQTLLRQQWPRLPEELIDRAESQPEYLAIEDEIYAGLDQQAFPSRPTEQAVEAVRELLVHEPDPEWYVRPKWEAGRTHPMHEVVEAMAWSGHVEDHHAPPDGSWAPTSVAVAGAATVARLQLRRRASRSRLQLQPGDGRPSPGRCKASGVSSWTTPAGYACTRARVAADALTHHEVGGKRLPPSTPARPPGDFPGARQHFEHCGGSAGMRSRPSTARPRSSRDGSSLGLSSPASMRARASEAFGSPVLARPGSACRWSGPRQVSRPPTACSLASSIGPSISQRGGTPRRLPRR